MIQGGIVPLYDPTRPQGADRVLLAGDAVGVDPLLGEGLSIAIGTGMLAGHAVVDAFDRNDFDFANHGARLAASGVGWGLVRNWRAADKFYARLTPRDLAGAFLRH
jgi:flavin-dependent dehydrogenase